MYCQRAQELRWKWSIIWCSKSLLRPESEHLSGGTETETDHFWIPRIEWGFMVGQTVPVAWLTTLFLWFWWLMADWWERFPSQRVCLMPWKGVKVMDFGPKVQGLVEWTSVVSRQYTMGSLSMHVFFWWFWSIGGRWAVTWPRWTKKVGALNCNRAVQCTVEVNLGTWFDAGWRAQQNEKHIPQMDLTDKGKLTGPYWTKNKASWPCGTGLFKVWLPPAWCIWGIQTTLLCGALAQGEQSVSSVFDLNIQMP